MNLARIEHPTDRPNFSIVHLPRINLVFSYDTLIAFSTVEGRRWVVRENEWGATTGKHLNYIDADKEVRIRGDVFEEEFKKHLHRLPNGAWV